MNPLSLLLLVAALPGDASRSEELFAKLDQNHDGRITVEEIPESQRSFFRRALRVADQNEDGSLTDRELSAAVSDPKPVQLPGTNPGNRMAGMDFKQFDRNGDGKLTIDEVPVQAKERFQQLFDRVGQKEIAIEMIDRYLAGERPSPTSDEKKAESKTAGKKSDAKMSELPKITPSDMKKTEAPVEGLRTLLRQLDKNRDGKLSKEELPPRMKEFADRMDSNDDGSIDAGELAEAIKRRDARK